VRVTIFEYIECFYNPRTRHPSLGHLAHEPRRAQANENGASGRGLAGNRPPKLGNATTRNGTIVSDMRSYKSSAPSNTRHIVGQHTRALASVATPWM
jgi:hypothetical protein